MFIIANGGDVYSRAQISDRCLELRITRKRCSKEAYEAFSSRNLQKLRWFKTRPPPLGVHALPLRILIDIDETGFYLKDLGLNYGRGTIYHRVRIPRHYTRKELKVNVTLAIEAGDPRLAPNLDGSVQDPRRWLKLTMENVDQFVVGDYCEETNPVQSGNDDDRIIMWDNLCVHNTAYVTNTIEERASPNTFTTINRPAICPKSLRLSTYFVSLQMSWERLLNVSGLCSTWNKQSEI